MFEKMTDYIGLAETDTLTAIGIFACLVVCTCVIYGFIKPDRNRSEK